MSYITPRVLIQQEFLQLPVYSEFPLPAFVVGPHFALSRYSVAAEKPFTALATLDGVAAVGGNAYVSATNTTYDVPNVPAGGEVDHSYTKVFADAVQAQYFPLAALGDSGVGGDSVVLVDSVSGQKFANKVRFTGSVLTTANGVSRDAVFSNRDVKVDDTIEVTDNLGNVLRAKVKALEPETATIDNTLAAKLAPVIASGTDGVTSGSNLSSVSATFVEADVVGQYVTVTGFGVRKILARPNATTLTLDAPFTAGVSRTYSVGGTYNAAANVQNATEAYSATPAYVAASGSNTNVTITNSSTGYKGYSSLGIFADVYSVTVTAGSTLGNVRFSITSQNGAFAVKENVALVSNILTLDTANNNALSLTFTGSTAFVLGSTWTLAVTAGVTQVRPTITGTYSNAIDMVYRVLVTRGGAFYDGTNSTTCAQLLITASDVDSSSVVLPAVATAFNVGSFGVRASFASGSNNSGFIVGDAYYIPVYAARKGAVTIVELSEALSQATITLSSSITAKLFVTQSHIEVPAIRDLVADTRNWTQEGNYITINSGITTYDNALVSGGTPVRLPVKVAKLFVEHRDLLQDSVVALDSVRSLADVSTKLGTVHPDNPLAQGVYDAVLNAQNQLVYFLAVGTNDLAGYTAAIKIAEKSDKVYGVVPLTFDRTIQDAIVSHVNAYSTPEVGRWRVAWLSVEDTKSVALYDLKTNGTAYQATVTDDPNVTGTQNKLVTIAGATFIEDGVRPNDSVLLNFRLNADGVLTYDEYTVDQVRTNTTLTITTNLSAAITAPAKVKVLRNYTKSERAANIAAIGGDFNNRRVRVVFPDTYKYGGVTKRGYFAAAGLAGLRSGVVPHQGLTNAEFLGADDLSKVVIEFTQADLDTMAEAGIWLITQEVIGATPYVRHQLTSDESSLNTSEDSITTNVDSISYALKKTLAPFIGRFNVNVENVAVVRAAVVAELTFRATDTFTARAGNQLTSFTPKDDIIRIAQNATFKDRIDVEVRLNVPYPLNYLSLKLIVG